MRLGRRPFVACAGLALLPFAPRAAAETLVQGSGVAATQRRDSGIYIDRLGVDPARQGSGLGSFLLVRIEEIARSSGLKGLSLETAEMAEGNIRLYRRHGFEIVSRGLPSHGKDAHMRVYMAKMF